MPRRGVKVTGSLWAIITEGGIACTMGGSSSNQKLMVYETKEKATRQLGYAKKIHGDSCKVVCLF